MNSDIIDMAGFMTLLTETSFAPLSLWAFTFQLLFFLFLTQLNGGSHCSLSILDKWLLQPCCWLIFKIQLDVCQMNMCCSSFCQRPECSWVVCCTKLGSTVTGDGAYAQVIERTVVKVIFGQSGRAGIRWTRISGLEKLWNILLSRVAVVECVEANKLLFVTPDSWRLNHSF